MHNHEAAIAARPELLDFYRGTRILVAGADGFIGYNCVRTLEALGAIVSVITRRTTPRVGQVSGEVFRGDLRDPAIARNAVRGQALILDFVGCAGAVESNRDPQNSLEQDCKAHLMLFQAASEVPKPPKVLFASSRLVYGKPLYLPVNEEHPLNPESIYAVHKITVEHYLRVLGAQHGVEYCIVRLSNPYGPYQENNGKAYGVINRFLRTAALGEDILVYGNGEQKRDYIHVDDAVIAFLIAAMTPRCTGQVFNLGGSAQISIAEAAEEICEFADSRLRFVPWPEEYRVVETGDYLTDTRKLSSFVQLPSPIALEEGLASAFRYYRREVSGRRPIPHATAQQIPLR